MAATTNPELTIRNMFVSNSLRLSTAESCTGGLVANRLTNIDGSSAYFLGGVVAYSNAAKVALLGVRESDLDHFGAVSEPVARAMAEGSRVVFGSEYAIGVTGIAGPGGGTPEKPVGLVYIAVAGPGGARVEKHQFSGDRLTIKSSTADRALAMLLEAVS